MDMNMTLKQWATKWLKSAPAGAPKAGGKWLQLQEAPNLLDEEWNLDQPLVQFSPYDMWTIRMACSGTAIFGETGSGKTSGSGAAIARSFLRAGFGGLVLCSKPEERRIWERLARECGRETHLIIFGADQPHRFNFLTYEQTRQSRGGGQVENLVELLMKATEFAEGRPSLAGEADFWERASREMLRAAISILTLAQEPLSLEAIKKVITEAPQSIEEAESEQWQQSSYCAQMIAKGQENATSPRDHHDWMSSGRYWMQQFAALADRTRSSVVATFTSVADSLNHGIAWELFGTETNVVPEVTYKHGAIIILDLPLQEYFAVGRLCQSLFKYLFQRAMLQRDVELHPRPVFLWCDEAQNFLSADDARFQSVARSSRVCSVLLSQSTSGYYALLKGSGRDEINALLGNLTTKVFHANSDQNTNQYAADLIGKHWRSVANYSTSRSTGNSNSSAGGSQQLVYKIEPVEFTTLRKGGPQNNLEVDAVVYQGGRAWTASSDTYMRTVFKQG